jgi:hypothetical protein
VLIFLLKFNEKEERIAFLEDSTIDGYLEQNGNENVSQCCVTLSTEIEEYIACAGEGSWGGDGIVYVIDKLDNQLVWFLFSDSSNPFYIIEIKNDTTVATSTLDKRQTIRIRSSKKSNISILC